MPEICDGQMDILCNVLKKLAEEDFSNEFNLRETGGKNFSNLPLFEAFSPENLKKG